MEFRNTDRGSYNLSEPEGIKGYLQERLVGYGAPSELLSLVEQLAKMASPAAASPTPKQDALERAAEEWTRQHSMLEHQCTDEIAFKAGAEWQSRQASEQLPPAPEDRITIDNPPDRIALAQEHSRKGTFGGMINPEKYNSFLCGYDAATRPLLKRCEDAEEKLRDDFAAEEHYLEVTRKYIEATQRISELEAQNAELVRQIADWKAQSDRLGAILREECSERDSDRAAMGQAQALVERAMYVLHENGTPKIAEEMQALIEAAAKLRERLKP